jgi:hypothetical protein
MAGAITWDTTLIAGIMGLIGALLGAGIGGWATYHAAGVQFRLENEAKIASAVTSVLSEILCHYPTLYLDLDRCLPLWLSRMHLKRKIEVVPKEVCPLPIYDMRIFEERFSDVMTSRYGENIRYYYTGIRYLNGLSKEFLSNGLPSREFGNYITNLRLLILSGDD